MDHRNRTLPDHRATYLYRHNAGLGRDHRTYCPTCHKTGSYLWGDQEHTCDCRQQLNLHKLYLDAGIGLEYQVLSWDDWHGDPQVKELCRRYVDGQLYRRGTGLLFRGEFGVGKTMAANLVAKDMVKAGVSTFVVTFSSMIDMYTGGWRDQEEREIFIEKVKDSEVLVLDDVGRSQRSSAAARNFHESTFDDVIRPRIQHGKAHLLTTNLSELEMGEGYGAGILSLIDGHALDYEFTGSTYRPIAKKRTAQEHLAGLTRPIS